MRVANTPMLSWNSFHKRITHLWFAPDLMLIHQRRERRMLMLTSVVMLVMGLACAVFFSFHRLWWVVAQDVVLILAGLTAFALTWRDQTRSAIITVFAVLLVVVCVISVLWDVPNASASRSTHLFLLPLCVAALMTFRDEAAWLRHGLALISLLAFILLMVMHGQPLPDPNLPDSVRLIVILVQSSTAMLLLYGLLHIMQTDITERSALENGLIQALAQQQFQLYYQPQMDANGKVIGAETLLRWLHPQRGLTLPGQFIGIAEQTGLILPIGNWVLETACAQLRAWADHPLLRDLHLAVNISQKQFLQNDFVAQVESLIERYHIDPCRLELELTESILVHDVQDITHKMSVLGARGVTFSLDDFGTGYSSLSYLNRLPLNKLKIDKSFVHDVLTDPHSAAIAKTVVTLGQSLGLMVIAEGVETEGQRQFLLSHGYRQFQGYLFSQPVPIREFEALVCGSGVCGSGVPPLGF